MNSILIGTWLQRPSYGRPNKFAQMLHEESKYLICSELAGRGMVEVVWIKSHITSMNISGSFDIIIPGSSGLTLIEIKI